VIFHNFLEFFQNSLEKISKFIRNNLTCSY
jgi:hypothetical protein